MEKKTYRNAIRSRKMIRAAFIELLRKKPLEQIKVVDIVEKADLSRNTFYAHYQDVYAVLEEYQNEVMNGLAAALEDKAAKTSLDTPIPLLLMIADHISSRKEIYRVLLAAKPTADFIHSIKRFLIDKVTEHLDAAAIEDKRGFLLFIEVLAAGYIDLIQQYLRDQTCMTAHDIAHAIDKIYQNGIGAYMSRSENF